MRNFYLYTACVALALSLLSIFYFRYHINPVFKVCTGPAWRLCGEGLYLGYPVSFAQYDMSSIDSALGSPQPGTLDYEIASDEMLRTYSISGITFISENLPLKVNTFSVPYFIVNVILWYIAVIFAYVLYKYLRHYYLAKQNAKQ